MTKAMKTKVMAIINEYHNRGEAVHGAYFHHYGYDYRIEEQSDSYGNYNNILVIFRHNPYSIFDTVYATAVATIKIQ